ncbi:MAG TPA: hypothetical protein VMR70_16115 [Flavisolibacter sp.]|nr:hypothetical protein [Flavisolibacter sp.]
MKIYWLAVFILAIAACSCKKEGQAEKQLKSQITGQWELEIYSCGECPVPFTSYPQGSGHIIAFTKDGRFIRKLKDSIIFSGRYAIVTNKECTKTGNLALQTTETANGPVNFITIENLKLQLSTPACYSDGATSVYRRIE